MRLNISSRKSDLARLQAFLVGDSLLKNQNDLEIKYHFKESLGDINLTDPLWKIPQKGVFTEDFNHDLISGQTDLVVHSWKDLPVEKKKNLSIVATLNRADQRDILLVKKKHLPQIYKNRKINLYSSSPRRFYNIEPFLKTHFPFGLSEVHFESVRGNIPTRLNKLISDHQIDGLVVAKAALDRLLLTQVEELQETRIKIKTILAELQWMVLPLSENPNAAAQGALAIEIQDNKHDLLSFLNKINHPETFSCVEQERKILAQYGGGCHQKIGVACVPHKYGQVFFLKGLTDDGVILDQKILKHEGQSKIAKKFSIDQIWSESNSNKYFNRLDKKVSLPKKAHYFIAKADSVPAHLYSEISNHILWTAGTTTWKKLAAQGLWVHGTQDGLGENEPRELEAFADAGISWHKLTHGGFINKNGEIACYDLVRNEQKFDFTDKECFFWNSGSLFLAALSEYPGIADKIHCCGPGNSAEIINASLSQKKGVRSCLWSNLFIFLNQAQWSDYVTR